MKILAGFDHDTEGKECPDETHDKKQNYKEPIDEGRLLCGELKLVIVTRIRSALDGTKSKTFVRSY